MHTKPSESQGSHSFSEREREVKKLRAIAVNLGSSIRPPGGYRTGLVGFIPLFGDLFDFVWKANEQNMRLLESRLPVTMSSSSGRRASIALIATLLLIMAMLIAFCMAALALLVPIFQHAVALVS